MFLDLMDLTMSQTHKPLYIKNQPTLGHESNERLTNTMF